MITQKNMFFSHHPAMLDQDAEDAKISGIVFGTND